MTRSDLRHLACSAWLLPSDARPKVEDVWLRGDDRLTCAIEKKLHLEAVSGADRWGRVARAVELLPRDGMHPAIWLGDVGGTESTDVHWYVGAVRQFLDAQVATEPFPSVDKRDRPLVAIPLVGTGGGGHAADKGPLVRALVQGLDELVTGARVDLALVTHNSEAHAAAQWARRQIWQQWDLRWERDLADDPNEASELIRVARELGRRARSGRLVAFIGAGVSAASGLPDWDELLERLAAVAGISHQELIGLDHLDQANVLAAALDRGHPGSNLGEVVAEQFPSGTHSLAHSLLAALPVEEFVTTNYDDRLEQAAQDSGASVTVLRYSPVADAERWLLKLHGSVTDPREIVLTRSDYLDYAQRRAALRGIVQAMLMTRHMLFVGVGLSDDNFHRIAHDVRLAIRDRAGRGTHSTVFGTALLAQKRPVFDLLWGGDIDGVALGPPSKTVGPSARTLEVLLDLVLAEATSATGHLMDQAYDGLLSDDERRLRDDLRAAWAKRPQIGAGPVWAQLEDLLRDFGGAS